MSKKDKSEKKGTLKNACISAIIASLILTAISLASGYYVYNKIVKPSLEEAGIDFNLSDIPEIIQKYKELIAMVKEYDELKDKYVTEQNWEKLDELNRTYEDNKEEIEQLKLIMETYNIEIN